MPDTDLVVEVDAPAPVVVEQPAGTKVEVKPEAAVKSPAQQSDPVADLKEQLKTLEAAKTAEADRAKRAEADATTARAEAVRQAGEAAKANASLTDSNISAVDNAIAAAAAEAEGFGRDQEAALAAGNFKLATELGRKASRAEARIERLEEGKADLAARKAEQPKTNGGAAPAKTDPFEQAIAGSAPRAQQWLREHRQYVTDPELSAQANLAHTRALKAGLAVDSDAYFDFCEKDLGLKQAPAPAANGDSRPKQEQQRTRAMPSAPVSRDGAPSGGSLTPTQVTLTPGEQARAQDGSIVWNYNDPKIGAVKGAAIGIKEYARRKLALTQAGAYDRSFTEQ